MSYVFLSFYFFYRATVSLHSANLEREIMFAQIRILTSGDVTKEFRVLNVDTWSALGELNEKIKESKRSERLYKK